MLKPVEKQRVAEEIAEQLRSLILNGQYPPGSKLPPERELSKRLRVNRASLREALKKLEHLGLVRIRQGDGTRVQNFMETGGIELVQHLLPLAGGKPELIRDLLEFRRIFGREPGQGEKRVHPDTEIRGEDDRNLPRGRGDRFLLCRAVSRGSEDERLAVSGARTANGFRRIRGAEIDHDVAVIDSRSDWISPSQLRLDR
jgi:DNA-binding transcriptional MocR family regulator